MTGYQSRIERFRSPQFTDVMEAVAVDYGVCTRPIAVRRIDLDTGEATVIDVPCGATLASKCPSCAERRKRLRMAQCRVGWHLEAEPNLEPDEPTDEQRWLVTFRADVQAARDAVQQAGQETGDFDQVLDDIDEQLRALGIRGKPNTGTKARRTRSTKRRQDASDLPRRRVDPRTVGRAFTTPEGKVFRPSMGLTLTLGSYGRVHPDGTPVDPAGYDYRRAARDAIHFPKLVDRFWQNLRRVVGYEVQYFATVEPQKRLAPHLHAAMRGTISRADLRQVVAATYHQVWWPPCDTPVYIDRDPEWDEQRDAYLDPDTRQPLPTWDEALDALDADGAQPCHVLRFGVQLHAEGVLAGTERADRWIGYVGKYLTKTVDQCHAPETDRQRDHVERLWRALRFEPCSPTCANWLRYGIHPKDARSGLKPGFCNGRAHRRETLGFGGRRVLVSRKWSGKTLADHKHDQRAWVLATLGISATDPQATRYAWEPVRPDDPDVSPLSHRLMRAIADRNRWRERYEAAKRAARGDPADITATGEAA